MERYVVGFAFDKLETKIALMLKARPDWQKGRFNGIGGHIEKGESPLDAMEREWQEETESDEVLWAQYARLSGNGFDVYFFRGNTNIENLESHSVGEHILVVPLTGLPMNIISNLNWLIPMARTTSQHDWPYHITETSKG